MSKIQKVQFLNLNRTIETGFAKSQASINNEIYSNLDYITNLDEQRVAEFNTIKSKTNEDRDRIAQLTNNTANNSNKIDDILNVRLKGNEGELRNHAARLGELDERIKNFNVESLNGLSKHFKTNSEEMKKSATLWLQSMLYTAGIGLLLEILTWYIIITKSLSHYLYLLIPYNILYISLLYFTATQYSHYKRLALDAKNREVVANSYLGILNNSNDPDSRNIITRIVADTLFSRNVIDSGAELPIKEIARISEKIIEKR